MPVLTRPAPARRRTLLSRALQAVDPAALATARTGAGVVMVARPTVLPRLMGVDSAASTRLAWTVQMLGAREIALGVGTLASRGAERRRWVGLSAFCDALDVLAVGGALVRGRVGRSAGAGVVLTALGAAVVGARSAGDDRA